LLAQPVIAQLTVVNPAPGGGVSNALTFANGQPAISAGGVVNAASYTGTVVAGSLASLFGTSLAALPGSATTLPLPLLLNGVIVSVNFNPVPLIFVSPLQINFQIPWEVAGSSQGLISVNVAGIAGSAATLQFSNAAPAVFALNQSGSGPGAVLIANSTLLAQPASVGGARPAAKGEFISIFCTGLGPVSPPQADGQPAPSTPASLLAPPSVTIGGQPATVSFAGLAPGFVGLYQVNAMVPLNAPSGDAVALVVTAGSGSGSGSGGAVSNSVTIAVQ
jgi:uncharacterized protein (TIGR03437 family)